MRIRERKSIYGAFHNVVEDAAASDFEGSRPAQPPADVGSSRAPLQGHAGVVTSDTSGVIVHANVKATEVFGYALSELVGQPVTMLMEEALRPLHQSFVERYLRTKEGRVINARDRLVSAVRKNGKHIKLLLSLTSMVVDGKLHFVAAFLVPQSTAMKISADPRGVITSASKNVARAFGWTASELVGQNVSVLCPEPHRKQHDQYIKRYDTFGMPRVLGVARNLRAQHRDGSTFPISLQVRKYHHGFKARIYPLDSSTEVMLATEDGRITHASAECKQLLGVEPAVLVGKRLDAVLLDMGSGDTSGTPWRSQVMCADGSSLEVVCECTTFEDGSRSRLKYRVCNVETRAGTAGNTTDDDGSSADGTDDGLTGDNADPSIGHYTMAHVLGTGAFGSVRLAYHRLTGMPVAIKTLKAANFREFGMAFPPREAMLLQKLVPHPCVMRLYETIERPDRIILIQEHLGGGDLFDFLMSKGSALDDAEAKRVFSQVVQGVHWLHLNGVVHRDLRRFAKIIDLGLGTYYERAQGASLRTFCGSIDYAAPEIFMRKPYNGFAVDVWALGVMLFAMTTSYCPFASPQEVVDVKLSFPLEPRVARGARNLVETILHFDPTMRPSTGDILRHPWISVKFEVPIEPPRNAELVRQTCDLLGCPASAVMRSYSDAISTTYELLREKAEREGNN